MKNISCASFAAMTVLLTATAMFAQSGQPSGPGSVTGDPAASSANPRSAPATSTATGNPSGSGTSSSGGRDDNGDQGRDKMPESNSGVRPRDQQRQGGR
ncbi:hypothetical protein ACVILH_004809 [Bradyrhizobium sp. USDA 4353]